jgi:hypothetical protein
MNSRELSALRLVVAREIREAHRLDEISLDDVKRFSARVTNQFKNIAAQLVKVCVEKLNFFKKGMPESIKKNFSILKDAMQQSGESFKLDDKLKLAKDLGKTQGRQSTLSVLKKELQGPIKQNIQKNENLLIRSSALVLLENKKQINEIISIATIGTGFAILNGLPKIFQVLSKLAKYVGANSISEMLQKASDIVEGIEEKSVQFVVPNKLAYATYAGLWKADAKLTKEYMKFEEFVSSDEGKKAAAACKKMMYKTLFVFFAFDGLSGTLEAGATLLEFVENAKDAIDSTLELTDLVTASSAK